MRKVFIAIVMMTGPPGDDNVHFSREGYRLMGRHYALRYLEVTNPGLAEKCRALINK